MAKLDKLKSSANLASKSIATSFISGAQPEEVKEVEQPQEAKTEQKKRVTKKVTQKAEKVEEQPQKSVKKVVIGARVLPSDMDVWRDYAEAISVSMGDLITKSVNEYMKRHKLSEDQQKRLELLKKLRELNS